MKGGGKPPPLHLRCYLKVVWTRDKGRRIHHAAALPADLISSNRTNKSLAAHATEMG